MRDRPFIEVTVDGQPVSSVFYSRLVSASLQDATGQDADTCELAFDDEGNALRWHNRFKFLERKRGKEGDVARTLREGVNTSPYCTQPGSLWHSALDG